MDLCSFLNVPFALSLVVKLRIKLLPSFIRRTKTRLLWENEASRGAVTTLQVVTRSLVSPPTEHCPRLHHSQKLCFNLPPSGFITGTPSEHAGEGLQRDGEGGGS